MFKKLTNLHYNLLRIAKNYWKKRTKREILDKLKSANPVSWANFATALISVNVMTMEQPAYLYNSLSKNAF